MGFAAANVFDPQNQRQVALISQFQNVFSILIFLAINGHHLFLQTAVVSYDILPPGHFNLSGEADSLELSVNDNGQGLKQSAPGGGLGLIGMRERAEGLAGEFTLESEEGAGVTIRVRIPLHNGQRKIA